MSSGINKKGEIVMIQYDMSQYYIDFSNRTNLTDIEKTALEQIQKTFRPIERVDLLLEYRIQCKITDDDFETMTGVPYNFGN